MTYQELVTRVQELNDESRRLSDKVRSAEQIYYSNRNAYNKAIFDATLREFEIASANYLEANNLMFELSKTGNPNAYISQVLKDNPPLNNILNISNLPSNTVQISPLPIQTITPEPIQTITPETLSIPPPNYVKRETDIAVPSVSINSSLIKYIGAGIVFFIVLKLLRR